MEPKHSITVEVQLTFECQALSEMATLHLWNGPENNNKLVISIVPFH